MVKFAIKVGGSVLVDDTAYRKQAERIQEIVREYKPEKIFVIVSARKGKTDQLISEVSKVEDEEQLCRALKGECRFVPYDNPNVASFLLQGEIESAYHLGRYLPQARVMVQDNLFPIVANSSYLSGKINVEQSYQRRGNLECPERIVIVSGFGAVDMQGNHVLLGRNASDVVAAMVGRLAEVDCLVYLKDVDGIYTDFGRQDQMIVPKMSYDEAKQMDLGKVLDKRVLEILEGSSVEVIIGHHERLAELLNPNSGYGSRINMRTIGFEISRNSFLP